MTEGEDFAPPPRKGAGRYLIALGLVAALVAGVYFFRATLSSLVGLSSGSDSQVVAQAGNRKAPKHQPAPAVDPSGAEAESTGEEDLLQEEMIEVGAEPEIDSGSETGLDPGGSITETAPEVVAPAFDEPARQTSSPAIEPATATVPPPTPPPNRDRAAQAQAIGGARAVTGIDWSRSSQGTRITIQFSDSFSNDDFRHDPLAWAADREMVSLLGVENFPKSEIAVGTDELKRIRLGFHPGQELRLVFDLSKSGSSIRDLKALGSRLEILIQ